MIFLHEKPLSAIREERESGYMEQTLDLYEAIAGLSEELASVQETLSALLSRINQLEGGK